MAHARRILVALIFCVSFAGTLPAKELSAITTLKEHIAQHGALKDPTQLKVEDFLKRCELRKL
jgi:hypothetical protein